MGIVRTGCTILSNPANPAATIHNKKPERRQGEDRRRRVFLALVYGSFRPRRRAARRAGESRLGHLDWYPARWLAVAVLIVLLSCTDACLTLFLMDNGAYEVNPIMGSLIGGSPMAFALVKFGLTAGGVVLLTAMARIRAFGFLRVSLILYLALGGYAILVAYELDLLHRVPFAL